MLAVFEKAIGKPPEELRLPAMGSNNSKTPQEIVENFQSMWPDSAVYNLSHGNFMALSHEDESPIHPRYIYKVYLIDLSIFISQAHACLSQEMAFCKKDVSNSTITLQLFLTLNSHQAWDSIKTCYYVYFSEAST